MPDNEQPSGNPKRRDERVKAGAIIVVGLQIFGGGDLWLGHAATPSNSALNCAP
jgi:hypothetical protein